MRDNFKIVKSIKKNLPYTVINIQNLEHWKEERERIEAAWQMTKAVKRQSAINAFNKGQSTYDGQVSKTTQVMARYQAEQKKIQEYTQSITTAPKINPQPSFFTRVFTRLVDWFLSTRF